MLYLPWLKNDTGAALLIISPFQVSNAVNVLGNIDTTQFNIAISINVSHGTALNVVENVGVTYNFLTNTVAHYFVMGTTQTNIAELFGRINKLQWNSYQLTGFYLYFPFQWNSYISGEFLSEHKFQWNSYELGLISIVNKFQWNSDIQNIFNSISVFQWNRLLPEMPFEIMFPFVYNSIGDISISKLFQTSSFTYINSGSRFCNNIISNVYFIPFYYYGVDYVRRFIRDHPFFNDRQFVDSIPHVSKWFINSPMADVFQYDLSDVVDIVGSHVPYIGIHDGGTTEINFTGSGRYEGQYSIVISVVVAGQNIDYIEILLNTVYAIIFDMFTNIFGVTSDSQSNGGKPFRLISNKKLYFDGVSKHYAKLDIQLDMSTYSLICID